MPKYVVPSFEIETIEEFNESYDGEMQEARLTNGWDMRIPAHVVLEKAPEPLTALEDGIYSISGVKELHKRLSDNVDGKSRWMVWSGEEWKGSPYIYYGNEDSMRPRLNYEGEY